MCQYMVDQILIGLKGFLRIFGSHLAGLIQGELAVFTVKDRYAQFFLQLFHGTG